MPRLTLLFLICLTSILSSAAPGDSLRVSDCTAVELEKICENADLKFLQLNFYRSDTLPNCIAKLTQLEELDISWDFGNNSVQKATVLPSIGKLTKLKSLTFSGYSLPIELPNELGQLTSLERLRIYNLNFESLPSSLGNLVNLHDAMLCGDLTSLPDELANWKNIKSLYLSGNHFQVIPSCIFQMTSLRDLNVSRNDLIEVSPLIASLKNLEELELDGNWELTSLPEAICGLPHLKQLNIKETRIHSIPVCLTELKELERIQWCDVLVENREQLSSAFGEKIKWSSQCSYLGLVNIEEAFGRYNAHFITQRDSIFFHVDYSFNLPRYIDEEYNLHFTISMPTEMDIVYNRLYPLQHTMFNVKYSRFNIWDVDGYTKEYVDGYIVFREVTPRKAEIYIYLESTEGEEQNVLLDRKLTFKRKRMWKCRK